MSRTFHNCEDPEHITYRKEKFIVEVDKIEFPKDRIQPQVEWSEEDERQWNNIWDVLDGRFELSEEGYKNAANWFKSIKNRYTWKPSDEQITWLYRAADDAGKDSRMKQILNELLSDLKKLREG